MKIRNGFVSNSSSSSFIINLNDINDDNSLEKLSKAINEYVLDCFFILSSDQDRQKNEEYYKNHRLFSSLDTDEIRLGFSNGYPHLIFDVFKTFKKNQLSGEFEFYTDIMANTIGRQLGFQTFLIDLNIPYQIRGDGSIDFRKKSEILDILSDEDYQVGPIHRILKSLLNDIEEIIDHMTKRNN